MKGSRTPGEGPSHPGDSTVPLHSTAWANWPEEGGPREGRPSLAPARTFSPSTTSNSTVSPSPTLRRNFLGLFLLMAVWQRKGHEKGEGSRPGVSLTPAGSATPISFCSPSITGAAGPEGGARRQAKFSGGEAANQRQTRSLPAPVPSALSLGHAPPSLQPSGISQREARSRNSKHNQRQTPS